jgi:hypothetical protein
MHKIDNGLKIIYFLDGKTITDGSITTSYSPVQFSVFFQSIRLDLQALRMIPKKLKHNIKVSFKCWLCDLAYHILRCIHHILDTVVLEKIYGAYVKKPQP